MEFSIEIEDRQNQLPKGDIENVFIMFDIFVKTPCNYNGDLRVTRDFNQQLYFKIRFLGPCQKINYIVFTQNKSTTDPR